MIPNHVEPTLNNYKISSELIENFIEQHLSRCPYIPLDSPYLFNHLYWPSQPSRNLRDTREFSNREISIWLDDFKTTYNAIIGLSMLIKFIEGIHYA